MRFSQHTSKSTAGHTAGYAKFQINYRRNHPNVGVRKKLTGQVKSHAFMKSRFIIPRYLGGF